MNEFLKLNRKFLTESYFWLSGIPTLGFSIYLYFFYSEVSAMWILIIYSLTIVVLPLFVIGIWYFDWSRKRKFKNRILLQKPYFELEKIGFNKKTIPNHNILVDYVQFAEINGCEMIFDIDIREKAAEFKIYSFNNDLSNSEFSRKLDDLKMDNIEFYKSGFVKRINTKKERLNSIQELENILTEFAQIVKKSNYNPIPIVELEKI